MVRSEATRATPIANADLPPESPAFRPLESRSTSGSWLVTFARRDGNKPEYWLKTRKSVRTIPPSRRKAEQLSAQLEYRTAVAFREYFGEFPEFSASIPRPVRFLDEFDAILTEYRGGRHLKDALFSSGNLLSHAVRPGTLIETAETCGRWLRLLHDMPAPEWMPAHPLNANQLRTRTEGALAVLRPEVLAHVPLKELNDWIAELTDDGHRMAVSHGDFQPGNVLISGKRISVIDLGSAGVRPPEDDLGFFVTFVSTYKERVAFGNAAGTRSFVREFCDAFLEGYGLEPAGGRASLRPFIAWLTVQRLADMTARIERWPGAARLVLRMRLVSWVKSELPLFLEEFA